MEWPKLKNIIILILLLVNVFLLVLVGSRRGEALRYDREALERTLEVLEAQGIRADPDRLSPAGDLPPLTAERDLEREAQLARALLGGGVEQDNRGGGLYLYRSGAGELSIRAGGELSADLSDGPDWRADNPERHAAALLRKMGIDGTQAGVAQEDGECRVRFRQMWNGAPIFSCEVEFVYRDGLLDAIRGTLVIAVQGTEEAGESLTLPTALLRFLDGVNGAGDVCSAILSMEPGYRAAAQPLTGGTRLTAVWLVSSDTAEYYLDCATGALTRLTDG